MEIGCEKHTVFGDHCPECLYEEIRAKDQRISDLEDALERKTFPEDLGEFLSRAKNMQKRTRIGFYPADVWEARDLFDEMVKRLNATLTHANKTHTDAHSGTEMPNTRPATQFVNIFDTEQK